MEICHVPVAKLLSIHWVCASIMESGEWWVQYIALSYLTVIFYPLFLLFPFVFLSFSSVPPFSLCPSLWCAFTAACSWPRVQSHGALSSVWPTATKIHWPPITQSQCDCGKGTLLAYQHVKGIIGGGPVLTNNRIHDVKWASEYLQFITEEWLELRLIVTFGSQTNPSVFRFSLSSTGVARVYSCLPFSLHALWFSLLV